MSGFVSRLDLTLRAIVFIKILFVILCMSVFFTWLHICNLLIITPKLLVTTLKTMTACVYYDLLILRLLIIYLTVVLQQYYGIIYCLAYINREGSKIAITIAPGRGWFLSKFNNINCYMKSRQISIKTLKFCGRYFSNSPAHFGPYLISARISSGIKMKKKYVSIICIESSS